MNTKRKLMFSFIGLILSIAVFSTVVFAWFAKSDVSSDFIVETGKLDTTTKLYHATDPSGDAYTWNELKTTDDVNDVITNMVPGQVVSFLLVLHNENTSSVDAEYTISFGGFKHLATEAADFADSTKSSYSSAADVNKGGTIPELFTAISVAWDDFAMSTDTDRPTVTAVKNVAIYDSSNYKSASGTKTIGAYVENDLITNTLTSGENEANDDLKAGAYVGYIIRFYFDPTVVFDKDAANVTQNPANSNLLMNQAFIVNSIIVNYTQKQQIIILITQMEF